MFKVNAPILHINTLTINDQNNGNGNGQLDPGEQVTMTINYSNSGHALAYDVDVFLEGQSGFAEILNPSQNFSSIGFFGVFNKNFDVIIDEDAPQGITVDFANELSMNSIFLEKIFSEKISALLEDFETGDFTKFNWQFSGNLPWETCMEYPYDGLFSARSGAITSNQTSEIKLSYQVMSADTITFIRKVSSEPADKLQFYVGTELKGEWSGANEGWKREAYYITPGNKTFRWVYSKNSSGNGGSDKGWLDNIVLPPAMCLSIWAGPDAEICAGPFQLLDSYGTGYATILWTSSGTGTFDDNTHIQPVYNASEEDIANGSVVLTLSLSDSGGNIVTDEMALTLKNVPEAPPEAEGPDYVDVFVTTTSDYTTTGIPETSEYSWYLEPADAGTIQGSGLTSTVAWNPVYIGTAFITVTATNECGEGLESVPFPIMVDNTVGIDNPEIQGLSLSIYPNPSDGAFNIRIVSDKPGVIKMKLSNVLGETIYNKSIRINNSSDYPLNLQDSPDGVYFLVIEGNEQLVTKKLVKK